MKLEEYKALLAQMIAEPDKAKDTADSIFAEMEKDEKARVDEDNAIKEEAAKNTAKIADLTSEINKMKAQQFLGTIGKPEEKPDPKEEAARILSYIINPPKQEDKK